MSAAADAPVSADEAAALFADLSKASALILAVSGGPDSTALLWLAARWRDGLKKPPKLIAITVDHGLRQESAGEARAIARFAKSLKVEHRTLRWTGSKPKTGIQEAAREARYRLLGAAARKAGATHIVTAHTQDDQAETVLFRLMRGSGVSGLAGMGAISVVPFVDDSLSLVLARPLLDIPKARLIATLTARKIPYADDPSNADPRFARPRLRALMPALTREGLTAERLARLASRVGRAEYALGRAVDDAQRSFCTGGQLRHGRPVTVDAMAFLSLTEEISLRLLGRMIQVVGNAGVAELSQLEVLNAAIRAAGAPVRRNKPAERLRRTLGGAMVTLSGTKLTVEPAPPRRNAATSAPACARKAPFTKPR